MASYARAPQWPFVVGAVVGLAVVRLLVELLG